jgi:hypothetical protein
MPVATRRSHHAGKRHDHESSMQPLNVALNEAHLAAYDVARHVARVRRLSGPERIREAYEVLVSAQRVLEAAGMAYKDLPAGQPKGQLRQAINDFNRAAPRLTTARNILVHPDKFRAGRVNAEHVEGDRDQLRISVGPAALDVEQVAQAASALKHELYAAVSTHEGRPVTRQMVDRFLHGASGSRDD